VVGSGSLTASLTRDLAAVGIDAPALVNALWCAWGEPHRRYHDRRHLAHGLTQLTALSARFERPVEARLAWWFHDAVYDTQAHDNEAKSAAWAREALAAVPTVAERVAALVEATEHGAREPVGDAALLVDVDLSILGADPAAYDRYEADVREEYGWVPDELWRAGRARVLRMLLDQTPLYRTEVGAPWEGPARANLERALAALV
jgi:predicted metal-dependent HD superfamily phosphohydrolase